MISMVIRMMLSTNSTNSGCRVWKISKLGMQSLTYIFKKFNSLKQDIPVWIFPKQPHGNIPTWNIPVKIMWVQVILCLDIFYFRNIPGWNIPIHLIWEYSDGNLPTKFAMKGQSSYLYLLYINTSSLSTFCLTFILKKINGLKQGSKYKRSNNPIVPFVHDHCQLPDFRFLPFFNTLVF